MYIHQPENTPPNSRPGRLPLWEEHRRLVAPFVLLLILAGVAFAYSPMISDYSYQGEDHMFLSQVMRLGYLKSLLLSWKDHFLPIYRFFWGGLHLVFGNAVPIRIAILGFHLLNVALIFHIVRGHTQSVALPAIASITFGFSLQVGSSVIWCINGHWGMSLSFVLLMSICLERLLRTHADAGLQPRDLREDRAAPRPPIGGFGARRSEEPAREPRRAGRSPAGRGVSIGR